MSKQTETLSIDGMNCQHCVSAVEKALGKTPGVEVEEVSIGTARVTYDASPERRKAIEEAIEGAGFSVR